MRVKYLQAICLRAVCGLAALGMLLVPHLAEADDGRDFIDEARLFYQVVACGQGDALPESISAKAVETHCKYQNRDLEQFRKRYVAKAMPFFAKHRPKGKVDTVVYPFGGGDLVSPLVVFPDAREITTISLEHAGDPRRLGKLRPGKLRKSLALYREAVRGLLRNFDNASANMRKLESGAIPGQLSFFIQALVVMDQEPVSLKFFRLEDDGSIRYLSESEIDALDRKLAKRKAKRWVDTDFSIAFNNMELAFRKRGDANAPVRIHRHISANLNNQRFPGSPLEKHLQAKGKVAAMTKAASYLLWSNYFSKIRDYLLANMTYMISDSTGIPPRVVRKAGFVHKTYGRYTGPFLEANENIDLDFQKLWQKQRFRRLPFRYGYPDAAGNYHMMITTRK